MFKFIFQCVIYVCSLATMCERPPEANLQESVLSFQAWVPGIELGQSVLEAETFTGSHHWAQDFCDMWTGTPCLVSDLPMRKRIPKQKLFIVLGESDNCETEHGMFWGKQDSAECSCSSSSKELLDVSRSTLTSTWKPRDWKGFQSLQKRCVKSKIKEAWEWMRENKAKQQQQK